MPIKSQAQRRKFAELLVDGKISNEVYERWNRGAGSKELPERVTPKAKSKGTKKSTSRPKAKKKASSKTTRMAKKRSTSTTYGQEAIDADPYGSSDSKRVMFEFQVASDAGLALLHQPPYGDRAIVLRSTSEIIGSVGFAHALAPFGLLPSFGPTRHFTPEVGLFWALFPDQQGRGYATESAAAMVPTRSINVMRRLGMMRERQGGSLSSALSILHR